MAKILRFLVLFTWTGCTSVPTLHSYHENAQIALAPIENPKQWQPIEEGPIEKGIYHYHLKLEDGRKKRGIVAILESEPILLK